VSAACAQQALAWVLIPRCSGECPADRPAIKEKSTDHLSVKRVTLFAVTFPSSLSVGRKKAIVAKRTTIELTDDLDGTKADETVEFELDGRAYEIDLRNSNAAKLRQALEVYISAARVNRRSNRLRRPSGPAAADYDSVAVRKWAESNGIKVNKRGRIPRDVVAKFHEAGY
jgi:nucleoid-associated protein Lsr2